MVEGTYPLDIINEGCQPKTNDWKAVRSISMNGASYFFKGLCLPNDKMISLFTSPLIYRRHALFLQPTNLKLDIKTFPQLISGTVYYVL